MPRAALSACALAVAACGELNASDYPGEPRYVLSGVVVGLLESRVQTSESYLAVVWEPTLPGGAGIATWQIADVRDAALPADFALALYDPPGADRLDDYRGVAPGVAGRIGVGHLVVFEDIEANRTFDGTKLDQQGPDLLRGDATQYRVIFADDVSPALIAYLGDERRGDERFLDNPAALRPGFNLARTVCVAPGARDYFRLRVIADEMVPVEPFNLGEPPCPPVWGHDQGWAPPSQK